MFQETSGAVVDGQGFHRLHRLVGDLGTLRETQSYNCRLTAWAWMSSKRALVNSASRPSFLALARWSSSRFSQRSSWRTGMLCCCLSRPISSTYFIRSASVSVIRALYLGFVSDFPNDAGQQASAAGGVVEFRASSFALLPGYRRYLIPRMSAMEYRAGGLPRSHSAARRAPRTKVSRLWAVWFKVIVSPSVP